VKKLKVRHRTFRRGNKAIIVNYAAKTGIMIDAGLFVDGQCVEVTGESDVVKKWASQ
jgi:hypothetical protein